MNAKLFKFVFAVLLVISFLPTTTVSASAPDVVNEYKVTVTPQLDGTLNLRYDFNYCAVTDFPSADFYIGMPNSHFTITAAGGEKGGDTGWVTGFRQSGVKAYVDFKEPPRANDCFTFYYEIHQEKMAYPVGDAGEEISFQYQPSWFDFATITRLEIRWQLPGDTTLIHSITPEPQREGDWAIWVYTSMAVNAKTDMLELVFAKAAFPDFNEATASAESGTSESFLGYPALFWIVIAVVVIIIITNAVILSWLEDDGGYSGGGGGGGSWTSLGGGGGRSSGGGGGGWGGSSGRSSSCACVSSCACACAGGGRAGCNAKGFRLPKALIRIIAKK